MRFVDDAMVRSIALDQGGDGSSKLHHVGWTEAASGARPPAAGWWTPAAAPSCSGASISLLTTEGIGPVADLRRLKKQSLVVHQNDPGTVVSCGLRCEGRRADEGANAGRFLAPNGPRNATLQRLDSCDYLGAIVLSRWISRRAAGER